MTEAHVCVCEQLAQGCYMKAQGRGSNPRPTQVLRPNQYTIKPQMQQQIATDTCTHAYM